MAISLNACEPWIVAPSCCDQWAALDPDQQETIASTASSMAWIMGRQAEGLCSVEGLLVGRDCGCSCSMCSTLPSTYRLVNLNLPFRIDSIQHVTVNGTLLDPADWRLVNWSHLARIDGLPWDALPDSGGLVVDLTVGYPPSALGIQGVEALACELAKLCLGQASLCKFPVRPIAAGGKGAPTPDWEALAKLNLTGVYLFDVWLSTVRARPAVGVVDPSAPQNYVVTGFEGS